MKKALQITKNIVLWIAIALAFVVMIFTLASATTDPNEREIFGLKFFIVGTDSMAETDFKSGDVIIVKEVSKASLKEGDVITFVSKNSESYGKTVTHKIRKITTDGEGNIAFVTYGTTTNTDDEALAIDIVGKYLITIPKLGVFAEFLRTVPGYLIFIFLPFSVIITIQIVHCVGEYRKYKNHKKSRQADIEEKLAENERMKEELSRLRSLLDQKEGQEITVPSDNETEEN